jgi:hypothetical protein
VILTENKIFALKIHCRGWAAKRLNHARIIESLLYNVPSERWNALQFLTVVVWPRGLAQPLTEMSTGNIKKKCFWGVMCGACLGLTALPPSMSRLSRQCGILNISQPNRPPRPVTGINLLLLLLWFYRPSLKLFRLWRFLGLGIDPSQG